jgi:DivIVA domain-containing protein
MDQLIAQVRDAAFPIALRGYDREAVDAYVKRVNRLLTDLEARGSPEAAIRRALDQVGEETSSILQRAQETANEITERSRGSADDRIREAEREAGAVTREAEERVRELEADYGAIWSRRDLLLDEVRDLAERLLATADEAADRFPTQDEALVETAGADTASFPQLEPPDEDTTVSVSFESDAAGDFEEEPQASPESVEERPPEHGTFGRPPTDADPFEDADTPPAVPAPGGFEPSQEPVELRPASDDEMDFVDPHDDAGERERSERSVADPPPGPHSP